MSECGTKTVNIEFFDANMFIGQPMNGAVKSVNTSVEALKEMDELGISKALIWHIVQHDYSPADGNRLVNSVVAESDRFWGCWTILPPQTDELIGANFFLDMKYNRIFALRAFPELNHYLMNRQVFGGFLDEVVDRQIPLILPMEGTVVGGNTWSSVYKLMEDYPELTCIICDTGIWLTDRYTRPLLENYPNLYLETSFLSLGATVLEGIVAKYGANRLVFGTGFPLRYPQAPMLQLVHAEILDVDKKKIASGNLENLISRARL